MTGQELFPLRVVTLRGIRHEMDEHGGFCMICGELVEYLLEQGGEGTY